MYSETSTPPFSLCHAPPRRSTVQHPQGLTGHEGCQLDRGHHTAAPWEPQYLRPPSRGGCDVSISEALQMPSLSNISTPQVVACGSDVASSLDCVVDQHRPPSIDPRLVDHTRDSQVTQGNASDYITNHGTTLPPSYTNPRLPHSVEWPSGYPREGRDIPTFGYPDDSFAAPTMGPIPSPHDHTAGRMTDSSAPWPGLPVPPSQELHPSDDFAVSNVPLPPEERRFFNTPHPANPLHAYIPGRQSLTRIPPQSNSMSYSTRCPIPSPHDYTAGRMTDPNAPWAQLPNSAGPPPQEPHPLDDFAIGNVPLPPKQGPFFNTPHPTNPLHALQCISGRQSLSGMPSQSNSMSYSTSHGYNRSYPPFPTLNQKSPSWIPQEHLGYPSSVEPHYTRLVAPLGFRGGIGELGGGYEGDSHHELSHHGTIQYAHCEMHRHRSRLQGVTPSYSTGLDPESKVHGDHTSCTLSDHKTHSFHNYAAYVPGEHTISGAVDDHGNFNESKVNSERVVDLPPQLPLPSNQLSLSPRKHHSPDRVSPIRGRSPSKSSCHTRRSPAARSRLGTKSHKVCHRNASTPCGWRDDTGSECGELVNCGNLNDHFATAHPIKKTAEDVKIVCRWCRLKKAVMRKNFPRHLKEVHLGSARSKKEN